MAELLLQYIQNEQPASSTSNANLFLGVKNSFIKINRLKHLKLVKNN